MQPKSNHGVDPDQTLPPPTDDLPPQDRPDEVEPEPIVDAPVVPPVLPGH
jgi:hypothetical protein